MATKPNKTKSDRFAVLGAGATGGGIGTIIAALATLSENSVFRNVLTISAPYIAVVLSSAGLFIKYAYIDPFVNKKKEEALKATFERALLEARAEKNRILSDPSATVGHKKQIVEIVEELEQLQLRRLTERLEVVLGN
jgi:hypothetical protein